MHQRRSGARNERRKDTPANEGLWDWNLESDRVHFSPGWITLVGCEGHEVGGTPDEWFQRVHPDDSAQLAREIESARTGESATFACRHRLRFKDGTYRWTLCRGTVVRNKAGRAIRLTGSHSDITIEMVTDTHTGLPNRLLLMDRLTHSIERSRRYKGFHFAVLIIDLGRSTSPASEPVATAVARRLETSLRIPETMPSLRNNDLVARMDGERFAILLDGLKEISHAKVVGERILQEILKPFALGGREVSLSPGIGVALSATGCTTADQVVHDAETALHRAFVLGGARCEVFDTGALKSEQAELQLEGDFEAGLQRGEFELYYQPIVSLRSNELLGFEALVRWRHPVLGMIMPVDFLPVAEKTGFIVPLGNWILREACLRLNAWQRGHAPTRDLSISVNLSSTQLKDVLVDEVADALRDSGLESRRLTLELTEGVAMANPTAVTTLLMRLRAMGIRISVDDFGTGYSSLAYLRQFPLDVLKIDRSFVRGMVTNKDTAEIVAGLIGMARQLGLQVIAEGIEHEDQLAHLRTLKCDAGQGNLFAKPLDVGRVAELLENGLTREAERIESRPAQAGRDQRLPRLWKRGSVFMASHRVPLAAAALALVFAAGSAGVAGALRAAPGSSRVPAAETKPALPVDAATPPVTVSPRELPASQGTSSIAAPSAQPPVLKNDKASEAVAAAMPLSAGRPSAPAVVKGPPVAPAPSRSPAAVSLEVVHLHRLGSCHGRLELTRDGLRFIPQSRQSDEAFTLKFTEFLDTPADDTLTVKSADKTYRFKAAGNTNDVQLRDLAASIARTRR